MTEELQTHSTMAQKRRFRLRKTCAMAPCAPALVQPSARNGENLRHCPPVVTPPIPSDTKNNKTQSQKNATLFVPAFLSVSSRACLGKKIVFTLKMVPKSIVFRTFRAGSPNRGVRVPCIKKKSAPLSVFECCFP